MKVSDVALAFVCQYLKLSLFRLLSLIIFLLRISCAFWVCVYRVIVGEYIHIDILYFLFINRNVPTWTLVIVGGYLKFLNYVPIYTFITIILMISLLIVIIFCGFSVLVILLVLISHQHLWLSGLSNTFDTIRWWLAVRFKFFITV